MNWNKLPEETTDQYERRMCAKGDAACLWIIKSTLMILAGMVVIALVARFFK